eukprot:6661184-Lingulodinium_polyedra.AAC.1
MAAKSMGYSTVSFTYAVYQCCVVIPKLATPELRAKGIDDLRKALISMDFVEIPLALVQRMEKLSS